MDNFQSEENEKEQGIPENTETPVSADLKDAEAESKLEEDEIIPEQKPTPSGFIEPTRTEDIKSLIPESERDTSSEEKKPKKFVIHIQPENIDYFESLSADDRSKIINTFLFSHLSRAAKDRRKKIIVNLLRHIFVILLTIVIGFPIIFYIVNKSITSTLKSYQYMQVNFERLYQERAIKKAH